MVHLENFKKDRVHRNTGSTTLQKCVRSLLPMGPRQRGVNHTLSASRSMSYHRGLWFLL
jgi:hypothetical protein